MVNITLAVPRELKEIMDKHPEMNWSEIARQAFREKASRIELLDAIAAKSKLTEKDALEIGRKVNKEIAKRHGLDK